MIDYDLDSEEEWNEQNGEDIGADNKSEEAEDDNIDKLLQEDEDNDVKAGFIVEDDYLSACELNLTQSQRSSMVQAQLEERRKVMGNRYIGCRPAQQLQKYIF